MKLSELQEDLLAANLEAEICALTKDKDDPAYMYCERHYVRMRSLGGSNDASNLVNLLPREHAVAHLLILKIAVESGNKNQIIKAACALRAFQNLVFDAYSKVPMCVHHEYIRAFMDQQKQSKIVAL